MYTLSSPSLEATAGVKEEPNESFNVLNGAPQHDSTPTTITSPLVTLLEKETCNVLLPQLPHPPLFC
jgi:hypothetical protein